jgi:hypothetical protein
VRGDTLSGKNGCEDETNLLRPFCTSLAARAQAHGRITASRVQPSAERRFAGGHRALPRRLSHAAPDRTIVGSRVPRAAMCQVRTADRFGAQDKSREVRRGRIAEEHGKISALRRGAFFAT